MNGSRIWWSAGIVAAGLLTPRHMDAQVIYSPSPATAASNGITVSGMGEAIAKPDAVEVKLRITGSAELTDDAIVKHRNSRERVQKAFDALKMENLKLEESNLSIRSASSQEAMQMAMRGMTPTTATPQQIEVSSAMRVRLSGISEMPQDQFVKTLGKLLDTAKDSGAALGPSAEDVSMAYRYGRNPTNTIVRFVVANADRLREEAYQKAVDDARKRGERLAKLNSLKLGAVSSVQETTVSGDYNNSIRATQPWETIPDPDSTPRGEITTDSMSGASFRVVLSVRFAIETAEKMAAQAP